VSASHEIKVERCHDADVLLNIFQHEYYDSPVCFFPDRLLSAASHWLIRLPEAFPLVATCETRVAGFLFGHSLGPGLWRRFSKEHIHLAPWFATYAISRLLNRRANRFDPRKLAGEFGAHDSTLIAELPANERPFTWTKPGSGTAYIDMVYVKPEFRGCGLAVRLLRTAATEMRNVGLDRIEAHIDQSNLSSVSAFLKAGWNVARASKGDFFASKSLKKG
jgi:GNAT superfamily N-acetyltransferase